jgi:hypothetical protein
LRIAGRALPRKDLEELHAVWLGSCPAVAAASDHRVLFVKERAVHMAPSLPDDVLRPEQSSTSVRSASPNGQTPFLLSRQKKRAGG